MSKTNNEMLLMNVKAVTFESSKSYHFATTYFHTSSTTPAGTLVD